MSDAQPKKLEIIYILKIMQKYTDQEHGLSQNQIVELLKKEYGMKVDRKSVKRNLSKLIEAGYPIEPCEFLRINAQGEQETILTDWRYIHDLTDSELRVITDILMYSDYLPHGQCVKLIDKIISLGSSFSQKKLSYHKDFRLHRPENKKFFYIIEVLTDAITNGKQVSFLLNSYGADMKLHPILDNGETKLYTVNPYNMVLHNGRYYLICNTVGCDNISGYRIDKITNIKILDAHAVSVSSLEKYKNGIELYEYLNENPDMCSGEVIRCTFRYCEYLIDDIVDSFGSSCTIIPTENKQIEVRVRVNEPFMLNWAIKYANAVKIISPKSLKRKVIDTLKEALKNYE